MNSWLDAVRKQIDKDPDKLAFISSKEKITYGTFYRESQQLSSHLKRLGLEQGEHILAHTCRDYRFFVLYAACVLGGFVFIPIDSGISDFRAKELAEMFGAAIQVSQKDGGGKRGYQSLISESRLENETVGVEMLDAKAQILFTTGSTGVSKGVLSTNRYFTNLAGETEGFSSNTVNLITTPPNHFGSLFVTFSTLNGGGTVIISKGITDIDDLFSAFEYLGTNTMFATPSACKILLSICAEELAALPIRTLQIGGEKCELSLKNKWSRLFPTGKIISFYGSTETGLVAVDCNETEDGCLGFPYRGNIVFENGGNLCVQTKYGMLCYYGETYNSDVYQLGDTGFLKNGKLYFNGRANETIITGGYKVSPDEVERAAITCPSVTDCLCVGKEDSLMGQIPILYYCGDASTDELRKTLRLMLEAYKVPKILIKETEIKRNRNDKKDRKYYEELNNDRE